MFLNITFSDLGIYVHGSWILFMLMNLSINDLFKLKDYLSSLKDYEVIYDLV